jgi:hypothetical protein
MRDLKGRPHQAAFSICEAPSADCGGSIDLSFGPKAPRGEEANWLPTDPKRQFELMFRANGPTKDFSTRSGCCRTLC